MATMKSFTDLPQSKTLSKILPFESADFCYYKTGVTDNWMGVPEYQFEPLPHKDYSGESIGCWSLAALISVLPSSIKDSTDMVYSLNMGKDYIEYSNPYLSSLCSTYIHTCGNDNLVDTCYEMILKLHELKKL